ncbi:interleukin enhancer-binding factor 2 homolog [Rhopilema esculentum]|uniref:interleukin enhancer-binding factor 2 homolog n=1 Tax=Rhopilema esculentum TaxID=499914 RepID=UPI0031D657AC
MRHPRGGMVGRGGFRSGPYGPPPPVMGIPPPRQQQAHQRKFVVTHQTFDHVHAESFFPRVAENTDDSSLTQALLKRNQALTPSVVEQTAVQNLHGKLEMVIESLILSSDGLNVALEEMRTVGSFKKGTMLTGHPVADAVVILKTIPTAEDIEQLAMKVKEKLVSQDKSEEFPVQANEGGFNVSNSEGALIRCLVTTQPKNLLRTDPEKHVDVKLLEGALATIRHARWFEENAFHTTVRVLVRILKDLRRRFDGFSGLTPWLIDLLSHRATMSKNSREPLAINLAFRRVLQLLSSGIFLPGSVGIIDPCETGQVRAHSVLSLEEQDGICLTAQTMLRCLSHGAENEILGLNEQGSLALDNDTTSWGGTIVTPGLPAYNKEEHKKQEMAGEGQDDEQKDGDGGEAAEEGEEVVDDKMET